MGPVKQIQGMYSNSPRNSYRSDLVFFFATKAEGMGIDVMDPSTAEKFNGVNLESESKEVEV